MQCPSCQSNDIIKRGFSISRFSLSGNQKYQCKSCGRGFTDKPMGRPRVPAGACPKCGSGDTKKIGHRDKAKTRIYCNGCGKSTVLGSGKLTSPKADDEAQDQIVKTEDYSVV